MSNKRRSKDVFLQSLDKRLFCTSIKRLNHVRNDLRYAFGPTFAKHLKRVKKSINDEKTSSCKIFICSYACDCIFVVVPLHLYYPQLSLPAKSFIWLFIGRGKFENKRITKVALAECNIKSPCSFFGTLRHLLLVTKSAPNLTRKRLSPYRYR